VREHRDEYQSVTAAAYAVARHPGWGGVGARLGDAGRRRRRRPGMTASSTRSSGCGRRCAGWRRKRDPPGVHGVLRGGTRPPTPLIMAFIAEQAAQGRWVESICRVLREQVARSPRADLPGAEVPVAAGRGAHGYRRPGDERDPGRLPRRVWPPDAGEPLRAAEDDRPLTLRGGTERATRVVVPSWWPQHRVQGSSRWSLIVGASR
jgi:hypothetical protein